MMLRIIFVLLLVFTVSYWFGYRVGSSAYDSRPVCFVIFGDALEKGLPGIATTYWGYADRPSCNVESLQFFGTKYNGTDVYFLMEKNTIRKEANGRKVTIVLNVGRYSKKHNQHYMLYLMRTGKRIVIEDDHSEQENKNIEKTNNERPGE